VKFRRDAQDLAALNAGKLKLTGPRVATGEAEMGRDLIGRKRYRLLVDVDGLVVAQHKAIGMGEHSEIPGRVDRA
jgi:hypothetical protein